MVVIILKVDPGGWGAEKACPASARTSPLRASRTAMPPERPASAETARSCRPVSIVVFTGAPGFGSPLARIRAEPVVVGDREQRAAGPAGEAVVEGLLEAADPDRGLGREAVALERRQVLFFGGPDFAGDVDRGAAEGMFAGVGVSLGERGAVGGEDRRPRRQLDLVLEVLVAAQAGEDETRVPGDAAVLVGDVEVGLDRAEGDRPGVDRDRDDRDPVRPGRRRRASRLRASAWSPPPPRRGRRS